MGAVTEARHNQMMADGINQTETSVCRIDIRWTGTSGCKSAFNSHRADINRKETWICMTHRYLCLVHLHQITD